jgi:hypothetical protein
VERLRTASEDDEPGDRRLGRGDARRDSSTEVVAEQEHTVGNHSRVLLQELDRGDRVR